jgi:hypothetical protein
MVQNWNRFVIGRQVPNNTNYVSMVERNDNEIAKIE